MEPVNLLLYMFCAGALTMYVAISLCGSNMDGNEERLTVWQFLGVCALAAGIATLILR